jgi:magnesium transporter
MTVLDILNLLHETLERGDLSVADELLKGLHPSEIARILESLPAKQREKIWELESVDEGEVLPYMSEGVRIDLMQDMDPHEVAAAAEDMDIDDAADLLQDLPDDVVEQVLQMMDAPQRQRLTKVLFYPEDSAGGIMNIDTLTVRTEVSLDVVFRYLRRFSKLPGRTDMLIVVDRDSKYLGGLLFARLLTSDPELTVGEVMSTDITPIPARTPTLEVARLFEERDFVSAPVIDDEGFLVGRITIDDVVDVIRAEAEHNLMGRAGLDEDDDMFAPILTTTYHRALWLGINLATAFLAAWVIGLFENTIEQIVALAVLMPIVASMGGIAGSQTLTVVIRGIALGKVTDMNVPWLLRKEVSVGLLNGLIWSVVVACTATLWFGSVKLGLIIASALIINLFFAALSGMLIPVLLNRLSIDPALAGGVILTTVTDVIGFTAFLGLATLLLLN